MTAAAVSASDGERVAVETLTLARVGTLKSSFSTAFGCPRQGLAAPSVRGRVELAPWMIDACGGKGGAFLEGLDSFSHVWIIFVFDQNRHNAASFDPKESFLRPTVKPPWLTDANGRRGSHGVFATRSPHRPNPIGLTVCRLDYVDYEDAVVYISGVDVVDGSAVLDIKPYHPIDSLPIGVSSAVDASLDDTPPSTTNGTSESICRQTNELSSVAHFPDWLPVPRPSMHVRWSVAAATELARLQPQCTFYPDKRDGDVPQGSIPKLRQAIEEVLGLDPRTPQSRSARGAIGEQTRHRYWALDFDALSIAFRLVPQPSVPSGADTSVDVGEATVDAAHAFEIVRVMCRSLADGEESAYTSKAWLARLRDEIEHEEIHGIVKEGAAPQEQDKEM